MVSNEANSGVVGTLRALSATQAAHADAGGTSAAAHAAHLRYALDLTSRTLGAESAYAGADWAGSWRVGTLDEPGWKALVDGPERQSREALEAVGRGVDWQDEMLRTGCLAMVAHSVYHLGAIRQLAGAAGRAHA